MFKYRNLVHWRRLRTSRRRWRLRRRAVRRRRPGSRPIDRLDGKRLAQYHDYKPEISMIHYPADERQYLTNEVSAIYVDAENLTPPASGDPIGFVQQLISRIVAEWPDSYPPISLLTLYVPADKTSLWRIWASALLPNRQPQDIADASSVSWRETATTECDRQVRVHGVQHFSRNGTKNSADMAIVIDVMDDLMLSQRAGLAAILSNDSDFYVLFDKLQGIIAERGHPISKVPLLWIVAPNGNNLSPEVKAFLPTQFVWDLSNEQDNRIDPSESNNEPKEFSGEILEVLVGRMKRGQQYRASDLHALVKSHFPMHELSSLDTAVFGHRLKTSTPELSDLGVDVTSTSGTSRYTRK